MLTKETKKLLKNYVKRTQQTKELRNGIYNIKGLLIHRIDSDFNYENHTFLLNTISEYEAFKSLYGFYPVGGIEQPYYDYDCTGKPFANPATFKKVAHNRWLVSLEIKYDV